MKNILLIILLTSFLQSCNHTPNKEARIQKLEREIQLTLDKIEVLEGRIKVLESVVKSQK